MSLMRIVLSLAMLAGLSVPVGVLAEHATDDRRMIFEGFSLADGRLLFRGERQARRDGHNIVEEIVYHDTGGEVTQRESAVYDSHTLEVLSYSNHHLPSGKSEWIEKSGDQVRLVYQKSDEDEQESAEIAWNAGMLVGSAMVLHLQQQPRIFTDDEDLELELLLPSRLDSVGLRLSHTGADQADGRPCAVVEVSPSSWLLRQFIDPIELCFQPNAPYDLIETRGRTAARSQGGGRYEARVVYRYVND